VVARLEAERPCSCIDVAAKPPKKLDGKITAVISIPYKPARSSPPDCKDQEEGVWSTEARVKDTRFITASRLINGWASRRKIDGFKEKERMKKYFGSIILAVVLTMSLLGIHTPIAKTGCLMSEAMARGLTSGATITIPPVMTTGNVPSKPKPGGMATQDLEAIGGINALVNSIAGEGITISNITWNGAPYSAGTFTGGAATVGFDSGIVLSTGDISRLSGSAGGSTKPGGVENTGDLNLNAPGAASGTPNASVLEFDFVPVSSSVTLEYVLGSAANNGFTAANASGSFGFFVNFGQLRFN